MGGGIKLITFKAKISLLKHNQRSAVNGIFSRNKQLKILKSENLKSQYNSDPM